MKNIMKASPAIIVSAFMFNAPAFAEGPACGEAQDDSWMQPADVQDKVEGMGYSVDSLGISDGNCYEVTGRNGDGADVITYLDPRSGEIVQEDPLQ